MIRFLSLASCFGVGTVVCLANGLAQARSIGGNVVDPTGGHHFPYRHDPAIGVRSKELIL